MPTRMGPAVSHVHPSRACTPEIWDAAKEFQEGFFGAELTALCRSKRPELLSGGERTVRSLKSSDPTLAGGARGFP